MSVINSNPVSVSERAFTTSDRGLRKKGEPAIVA